MNKLKYLFSACFLVVSFIFSLQSAPFAYAASNAVSLDFNSLPSSQGWTFSGEDYSGNILTDDTPFFFANGSQLHMDTIGSGDFSHVYTRDIPISQAPFTLSARARVTNYEEQSDGRNSYGFVLLARTGTEQFDVAISPVGIKGGVAGTGDTTPDHIFSTTVDVTQFHDYRIEANPGGMFELFVDDVSLGTASPRAISTPSELVLGDGTRGANAQADITSYSFTQSAAPASNGKILFSSLRTGTFEIYSINPDGSGITQLTSNTADDRYPAVSADGTKIAFSSNRDGNYEIYTMNFDGSGQTRLTNNSASDEVPSWSPDGSKIVFGSNRDGDYEIYTVLADGSGLVKLTNNSAEDSVPNWSPNGTKIAFASNRDGDDEIFVMNSDGTGQTQLTSNGIQDVIPDWSPDGTKIAFRRDGAGGWAEVYVMNADGSNQTNISNHPAFEGGATWSPDGTKLAFPSNRDGGDFDIYTMNADGTGQTRINLAAGQDSDLDWSTMSTPADTTAPTIVITTPISTNYLLNQNVLANYTCTDDGSGVDSCTGPVANGSPINTSSVGTHTFTVNATDVAGNTSSQVVNYTVGYKVCLLYDSTKVHKKGSTIPVKIQLCDANDTNVSSAGTVLTTHGVTQTSTAISGPIEDSGNANPDNNFRFEETLGGSGGYIYNLSTKLLQTGSYTLDFTVGADPTVYTVPFQVQ